MRFTKITGSALLAVILVITALPITVQAQATTLSIESVGGQIGLGDTDLRAAVIKIIQYALGFLALVAVAMIIFSGFIVATSPDSDRADTAKRVITGAVIGLVVVLLAWAIVLFVARTATNVTINA